MTTSRRTVKSPVAAFATFAAFVAAICVATAPLPSYAAMHVTEDVTLTEDADWTSEGTVTIAEGVTVDINGHSLTVAGLAGAGRIIDSKYSGGYTRLTYIQSTGSQYIDTGYIHDTTTKVDLRISFTSVGEQWQSFYGARNSRADTAKGFSMWLNYAKFRRAFGAAAANIDSLTVNTTTIYDLHLDKGGESTVTPGEGEPVSLGTATAGAALTWTDFLFAINQDPGASGKAPAFISRAKIYFCRIYSGDTLVRDMVPVRREADGALGVLDLANDATFYPNNGSGTFVAGEDVDESGHLRLATSDDASYDLSSLSVAAKCVAVGGVVAKDTDWSSLPLLSVEAGTVLDLAGHDLRVPALVGDGTITDNFGTAFSGYECYDYLQATQAGASQAAAGGNMTQYIDTGYRHNAKTEVDVRVAYTSPGNYQVVYGARNTQNNATQFGVWLNGSKFMNKTCQNQAGTSSYNVTANRVYDIHISKSGANTVTSPEDASVNYDLANGNGTDGNNTSGNDFLFAINQSNSSATGGWPCKCKVWFCKIYDAGKLVRYFVPVRRKIDGRPGMLDLVEGGFYVKANAGSAEFDTPEEPLTPVVGGRLHIVVADGETAYCAAALTGGLKLVKEGAGTLVMAKALQGYAGGTEIACGVLKSAAGLTRPCGADGAEIESAASGAVDFNGNANMQTYVYDFAEGSKALNTGAAISSGTFSFVNAFTPVATGAYGCTLSGESMLCLADWNGEWPIANVSFAADAAVRVNLAGRKDCHALAKSGVLFVTWGEALDNVSFTLDDDTRRRGFLVRAEETGLKLFYVGGTAVLIR